MVGIEFLAVGEPLMPNIIRYPLQISSTLFDVHESYCIVGFDLDWFIYSFIVLLTFHTNVFNVNGSIGPECCKRMIFSENETTVIFSGTSEIQHTQQKKSPNQKYYVLGSIDMDTKMENNARRAHARILTLKLCAQLISDNGKQ